MTSGSTVLNLTGYHLTFSDEFNALATTPTGSATQWATTAFGVRTLPDNHEQEYYSDSSVGTNPFSTGDGALTIAAAPGSNPQNLPYTSGEITSSAMFAQSTGYFEMRAELPAGQGMWPAFWLMPHQGAYPEVDAMEAFGAPSSSGEGGLDTYHWALHAPDVTQNAGAWVPQGVDLTAGYHTYGVDVETDQTTYYFDGQQVAQVATPNGLGATPLYMIANLAVGGSWPGDPAGEAAQMKIDYIRAYSKDPNVAAVDLQNPSAPDGAAVNLYGATTATNPLPATPPTSASVGASSSAPNTDATSSDISGANMANTGTVTSSTPSTDVTNAGTVVSDTSGIDLSNVGTASPAPSVVDVSNAGTVASTTMPGTVSSDTFPLTSHQVTGDVIGSTPTSAQFSGAADASVTSGPGLSVISAADGNNSFTIGSGISEITGGTGADSYTFGGAGSSVLVIQDFSAAKGDTLNVPSSLQADMRTVTAGSDTLLLFGNSGLIDLRGVDAAPTIHWT